MSLPAREPQPPQVFVSYSRQDLGFVKDLRAALDTAGYSTWVDLEKIRPTAEWLQEILAAIEAADVVVFVLSPDSLDSEFCALEVQHAAGHRKRLVPLLRREVDPKEAAEPLPSLQWIDAREGVPLEACLGLLVAAIETDLAWVRAHTRLLVRALEWTRRERNRSFLLRGVDLREGEGWLARIDPVAEPRPTDLQRDYVAASRRWARRARTAWAVAAVVLVLVSANLFSTSRRATAERLASRLAAQAEALRGQGAEHLDTSVLLAVEATRRFADLGTASLEADQALRGGLALLLPQRRAFHHEGGVAIFVLSPDGRFLATSAGDGLSRIRVDRLEKTARIWDVATGRELARLLHGHMVYALAMSDDGKLLATGSADGTARLWTVPEGRRMAEFRQGDVVWSVALSPDARLLATAGRDGTTRLWDAASGAELARFLHDKDPETGARAEVVQVAFDPAGEQLAAADRGGTVQVWRVAEKRLLVRVRHEEEVTAMLFSPGGNQLATASQDDTVRLWSLPDGRETGRIDHQRDAFAVAYGPKAPYLATASEDRTVRVFDVVSGREAARLAHDYTVWTVAFSPDAGFLATGGGDGVVRVWRLVDWRLGAVNRREVARVFVGDGVNQLRFTPDGRGLLAGASDGTVRFFDFIGGREAGRAVEELELSAVSLSPDAKRLATLTREGEGRVWGLGAPGRPRELAGKASHLRFSGDGRHLVAARQEGSLIVLDAATGEERMVREIGQEVRALAVQPGGGAVAVADQGEAVQLLTVPDGRQVGRWTGVLCVDLAVSSDGHSVAGVGTDSTVRLWRAGQDREVARIAEPGASAVALSPDGRKLAAGGETGEVVVWDVVTSSDGGPVRLVERNRFQAGAAVADLAFGRPASVLAAAAGQAVHVWNPATGAEVARMVHDQKVTSLEVSADGRLLATGSADGTALVWWISPGDLVAGACSRLSRNLTSQEWRRYLPGQPCRQTCETLPSRCG
ncbi:MAG TPA: TIR domain-containing protein [Thermoanaerobaculia bacterium]|nr:TIR domain-containing protein [Thermoanaerobaculia bacterium]